MPCSVELQDREEWAAAAAARGGEGCLFDHFILSLTGSEHGVMGYLPNELLYFLFLAGWSVFSEMDIQTYREAISDSFRESFFFCALL